MKKSEHRANEFYKKLGVTGLSDQVSQYRAKGDINLVKKLSSKKDKILDLACGYGRVTIPIAKAGFNITGIDLAPNLIKEAKRKAEQENINTKFTLGSMTKLPHKNKTFDKIFCFWSSFNHLLTKKEQVAALNEIYRVLKPSGFAFIELFNGEKKKMKEAVKKEGIGPDKRLWGEVFNGVKNLSYIHTRKTLIAICNKSKFKKYRVHFMNMNKRRRIVVKLYK